MATKFTITTINNVKRKNSHIIYSTYFETEMKSVSDNIVRGSIELATRLFLAGSCMQVVENHYIDHDHAYRVKVVAMVLQAEEPSSLVLL